MEESWRMRMGMSNLTHRKSIEQTFHNFTNKTVYSGAPESIDFNDVFGGPPRRFPGEFTRATPRIYFGGDVFRSPEASPRSARIERNLPAFRIAPERQSSRGYESSQTSDEFYSDIFGSDGDVRFQSKSSSKSKSSSDSSSEDLNILLPLTGEEAGWSRYASNRRPINVPCRWNSNMEMPTTKQPVFPTTPTAYLKNQLAQNDNNKKISNSFYRFSRQVPSPESIYSHQPSLFGSMKMSKNNVEMDSLPSGLTSGFQISREEVNENMQDNVIQAQETDQKDNYDDYEDDDDEMMNSYVIEINSDYRAGISEAISIDDAVAWAKEKYQTPGSVNMQSPEIQVRLDLHDQGINGNGNAHSLVVKVENPRSEKDLEERKMEILNEDIRLWSFGNEANIRLLLSTLHNILWPNSGWSAIPMSNLIESSSVKKAYQKARLCIHPDKLQQRGATSPQKYVAEKAFYVLQDAWAAFISQDVLTSK